MLPILHLNGYKIANPCVLARISHEELDQLFRGYGYTPHFVEGSDPAKMHQLMAATIDTCMEDIRSIQTQARTKGVKERPRWPMIILRSPKGWTCPKEIDGKRTEDYWRSHQVPMGEMHEKPGHIKILEKWMKSYKPEELFDKTGRLKPELADLPPKGERRMSDNPHANGGLLLRDLRLPDFRDYAVKVHDTGGHLGRIHPPYGKVPGRHDEAEHGKPQFPSLQSGRKQLKPLARCDGGHQSHMDGRSLSVWRSPRRSKPAKGRSTGWSLQEEAAHADPERSMWNRQLKQRIETALEDLTPRERMVFELRHYRACACGISAICWAPRKRPRKIACSARPRRCAPCWEISHDLRLDSETHSRSITTANLRPTRKNASKNTRTGVRACTGELVQQRVLAAALDRRKMAAAAFAAG